MKRFCFAVDDDVDNTLCTVFDILGSVDQSKSEAQPKPKRNKAITFDSPKTALKV